MTTLGIGRFAGAQAVSQSYGSEGSLSPGMIVQLDTKHPTKVLASTQAQASRMHGVVVTPNSTPVSLSSNSPGQQVYVATDGDYSVLVSDQNGPIRVGDYVTISSVAGVGMKADPAQSAVLGKALNAFTATNDVISTAALKESGHNVTLHLGYVAVDLSIAHNPLYQPAKTTQVNNYLQKFGQSIANKQVSLLRVYMSIIAIVASAIVAGMLLYAGVRTSMVAMGRNPLARRSIIRSLMQVVFTSLSVLFAGAVLVVLLLKL